jgi:protein SPIRAL1 and related proteins
MMETKDYTIFPDPEGVPIQSGGDAGFGKEPRPVSNNYTRPNGEINSSNFLTDRPSSRVLAPPGGGSNVHLG